MNDILTSRASLVHVKVCFINFHTSFMLILLFLAVVDSVFGGTKKSLLTLMIL